MAALIALLATAVSAYAGVGVTGPSFTTTPDTAPLGYSSANGYVAPAGTTDGLGVPSGTIKHVWVIVMENHAYEANFTGLNSNPYLSQTLPAQGAELTNYYGTGHSSEDNYLTMVSGQAPITDDQADCPSTTGGGAGYTAIAGQMDLSGGSLSANPNYGQYDSAAGANAPVGDNGCIYPASVPTLMNQLDAEGLGWKEYAQDMSVTQPATGQNAGAAYCGAPDSSGGAAPQSGQTSQPGASFPDVGSANATDQYVAKHNPMGWFQSITGSAVPVAGTSTLTGTDCNNSHIGTVMDGSSDTLSTDLASASTTPALSIISPDNCSDGHDATCAGNNLSGMAANAPTNASQGTPVNNVGGAYASDLFLSHVVPEIKASPAYQQGGLIAIVWDESYPQFTYSSDSFADSAVSTASAFNSLQIDSAGETLFGKSLNWEPSGPNVPDVVSQAGQQMAAGPGYNQYLHRPGSAATAPQQPCTSGTTGSDNYVTVTTGGCYRGGATSGTTGAGTFNNVNVTASSDSSGIITEGGLSAGSLISPALEGTQINSLPTGVSSSAAQTFIGQVTATAPAAIANTSTTSAADNYSTDSVQLVDASGNPVTLTGTNSSGTLTTFAQTTANDPFYDANDPTTGGGDSGALLIGTDITPGTVSNTFYNHYSLLRTLEDIFQTSKATNAAADPQYTGSESLSSGTDGNGHLGYAGQAGLAPFGTDVFTASPYDSSSTVTNNVTTTLPVTSTVNKTVTQTVTQNAPGSIFTVTTPGGTQKVKVLVVAVPRLTGLTGAQAQEVLSSVGLKLGTVKAPKAKPGYTLVVSDVSPGPGQSIEKGSKVNLTLKLTKG